MNVIPRQCICYIITIIIKSNSSVLGPGPDALFNPLNNPIGIGATIICL